MAVLRGKQCPDTLSGEGKVILDTLSGCMALGGANRTGPKPEEIVSKGGHLK